MCVGEHLAARQERCERERDDDDDDDDDEKKRVQHPQRRIVRILRHFGWVQDAFRI